MILLPDLDMQSANAVATNAHLSIRSLGIVNDASPFNQRLTVSIGVAVSFPRPGMDSAALMDCADRALYRAKDLGRNRTWTRELELDPAEFIGKPEN